MPENVLTRLTIGRPRPLLLPSPRMSQPGVVPATIGGQEVAAQLARDRRRRPLQPPSNLAHAKPSARKTAMVSRSSRDRYCEERVSSGSTVGRSPPRWPASNSPSCARSQPATGVDSARPRVDQLPVLIFQSKPPLGCVALGDSRYSTASDLGFLGSLLWSRLSESNRRPSHYEEERRRHICSLPAVLVTRPPAAGTKFPMSIRHFVPRVMPRESVPSVLGPGPS